MRRLLKEETMSKRKKSISPMHALLTGQKKTITVSMPEPLFEALCGYVEREHPGLSRSHWVCHELAKLPQLQEELK